MSNRKIGWAFSTERPVAVQSPSMLSDVQTRLNFSSVKSPSTLPKRRALIPMSRTTPTNTTPFRSTNNRLADYHMSKQNPDVLDRMYSSSVPSSPQTSPLRSQIRNSPLYHSGSSSTSSSPGVQFQNRMSHTPSQMSLLRQTLRANKAQSSSKSSLVQLATQRTSVKLNGPAASISPVVVRLSRGADTPPSPRLSRGSSTNTVGGNEEQARNPCDKDTVLSALRSKRKRWDSSASVDSSISVVTVTDQPSAKRSKNSVQSRSPPSTRKRPLEPPTLVQTPEVSKRSKIIKPIPKKANKICMPDIEYESDSSEHAQDDVSMTNDIVASTSDSDSTVASVDKREKTSPILHIDEEEMSRKREDSLSLLRTVFPPTKGDKSLRREVPVFCATGIKPHMPAPLSSGSTATREDLLKDREAAAERVKQFLTANNETPTTNTASTDPKPNTISLTTSLDGVKTTDQTDGGKNPVSATKSDVTTTSNSVQTGLKLSSALVGKMVSFANPITSGMPSTTTTISTSGGGTTSLTGLKLASSVPSTAGPPPSTAAATLGLPTGLSLLTAAAPLSSVTTTQPPTQTQTASLELGHDTAALKPSIGGLTFGTPATSSNALQTIASGLKLGPISTQATQLQLSTGLKIGTLNTATTGIGMGTLNTASSTGMGILNTAPSTGMGTLNTAPSTGMGTLNTAPSTGMGILNTAPSTGMGTLNTAPSTGMGTLNTAPSTGMGTLNTASFTGMGTLNTVPSTGMGTLNTAPSTGMGTLNTGARIGTFTGIGIGPSATPSQGILQSKVRAPSPLQVSHKPPAVTTNPNVQQPGNGAMNNPLSLTQSNPTLSFGGLQPGGGGLSLGNTQGIGSLSSSGLSFGVSGATTQQPTGLMFGGTATSSATQQPSSGLLFGNKTASQTVTNQQPNTGLMFGVSATQQSTGGIMFGNNTSTTAAQNPTVGFTFGNAVSSSSNLSFTASQPAQNSMFGTQPPKEAPKPSGLLFSGSSQNANNTFKFAANGGSQQQQPGFFSGGSNPQQSLSLNFGQSQPNTQSNSAMAGGGIISSNQVNSNSMFGGQNAASFTAQPQPQTSSSTGFMFSAGNNTQKATGGSVNFGQSPQTNVNFGMGQSQNANGSSAFSFSAGSGMKAGQSSQSSSGFSFNAASNGQSNVFPSPQQPGGFPQSNFTTPQLQSNPSAQGFNFAAPPNHFDFSVSTPPANSFVPGTPADSTPRPPNRRRRGRKK